MDILITAVAGCLTFAWKIHRKSNETQVIGRCERVMIRHDIVGVRKEKVILIVTGPFPFGLVQPYLTALRYASSIRPRSTLGFCCRASGASCDDILAQAWLSYSIPA